MIPGNYADEVQAAAPGWLQKQLDSWARWIDSRLRKRYAAPFHAFDGDPDSTPPQVQNWLARIVTLKVMIKRGVDPNDRTFDAIREDYVNAVDEVTEAANGDDGLFDIPLRDSEDPTAVSKGGPLASYEASPYVSSDQEAYYGHAEDMVGRGSGD